MKKVLCVVIVVLFLFSPGVKETFAQGKPKAPLEERVDKAIDKGVDYLKDKFKGKDFKGEDAELVLLTLLHAGLDKNNKLVKKAAKDVLSKKMIATYNVGVLAMALEELDALEYQDKIAECAQFLVDSQCKNGQWGYNCPEWKPALTKSGKKKAAVASGGEKDDGPAIGRIEIKPDPKGGEVGDNSNTQYALLGLRSAANANVVIPKETWEAAARFLESRQLGDGGWCYSQLFYNLNDDTSYGSITTAGLGGLCIAKFYLGVDIEKDGKINSGKNWLTTNFKVDGNPGAASANNVKDIVEKKFSQSIVYYYYMYGLERVGVFLKTDKFGTHDWYVEGAEYLLSQQEKEGKWGTGTTETCLAILFLKRATRPLKPVESGLPLKDPEPQDK